MTLNSGGSSQAGLERNLLIAIAEGHYFLSGTCINTLGLLVTARINWIALVARFLIIIPLHIDIGLIALGTDWCDFSRTAQPW